MPVKKTFCCLFLILALTLPSFAGQPKKIIGPGDALPQLGTDYDMPPRDRVYLGIPQKSFWGKKEYSLYDIKADVIVIEFFNNYCTSCQAQAPVMNEVFSQIAQQPELKGKVRFIGIGAGNNSKEVERFKYEKEVSFPLIPDPAFSFYEAIGDPGGTPFTIVAKKSGQEIKVVSVHIGLTKEPGLFLAAIKEAISSDIKNIAKTSQEITVPKSAGRMLELKMPENKLINLIKQSMLAACESCSELKSFSPIQLSTGDTVYMGLLAAGEKEYVLFSKVMSKKPVCDVCHGVHYIISFNAKGIIAGYTPVHLTKIGNVEWNSFDNEFMQSRLLGLSINKARDFDPAVDAVSMATMSSAIIFNSIKSLQAVLKELESKGSL